jgi:hypothetical protein
MVVLVLEELWDSLTAYGTCLRITEMLGDALNTEPMPAREQARLDHNIHTYRAVSFYLFFLLFVV